jgi:hypothetical protein
MKFKKFISAIASDWLARMSGPLTVPFTIAAIYGTSAGQRNLFLVLSLAAVLLTSYRVWVKEYVRAEAETIKNSKPEIRGEVFDFKKGRFSGGGHIKGTWHCHFVLEFKIYLCNHRPIGTTIKNIVLDGAEIDPPMTFSEITVSENIRLEQGDGLTLPEVAEVHVEGKRLEEIRNANLKGLKVSVIDAFGDTHLIGVKGL